jgi:ATP-dependent helicase/DNAse subunit B
VRQYQAAVGREPGGGERFLWLAPTAQAAAAVRRQLVGGTVAACLGPGITTFNQLAHQIVRACGVRVRRLEVGMRRELLRQVVEAALETEVLEFYADAARRPGFIDLLADHIRELKRHEIRPAALAKIRQPPAEARKYGELAALYADYQRQLSEHRLADAESVQWEARDALADKACPAFRQLRLLVADGFTDFTSTQHEILKQLAQRAEQFIVTLQADVDLDSQPASGRRPGHFSDQAPSGAGLALTSARADLFAKASDTLAELRRHHMAPEVRPFAPRASRWPALDYLAQQLFRHPRQVAAPPDGVGESLDRLEIIEAASTQDEIVQVARRIKRLLCGRDAESAGDIVVVFRTLGESAERVREVFSQFEIPYWLDSDERLGTAGVVKSLAALLRLDDEDWPFRGVISVVTNNTLTAFDAQQRQAAERLVRDLQVAAGRAPLLERIEQLATDETPLDRLSTHMRRRVASAQDALPVFRLLTEGLDGLPEKATASQWCDAWEKLGVRLGLAPLLENGQSRHEDIPLPVPVRDRERDFDAWKCIVDHFAALEQLDTWLGLPPRMMSRSDALAALADIARTGSLPRSGDDVGRVRVLSALTARTITAKHVFLAGMSEQAFPSAERAGRLATEAEYRALAHAQQRNGRKGSSHAPPAATRAQEEMLLFYGVLNCAEQSLTISYPALDDKAQQLPASPYVTELRRILDAVPSSRVRTTRPQLSPIAAGDTPFSAAEWRVQAVAQALAGDVGLLAGLFKSSLGVTIEAGMRIVHERARGESFGPAEGLLNSPTAATRCAARFGTQHLWSPSQWETYAACPYKFFLEQVLRIEPLGDLVLETDFARRGSRLHDVLAEFHRDWLGIRAERGIDDRNEAAAFIEHFCRVIDDRVAPHRAGIDAALLELDRRQLRKWAESHRDHHARYDGQWSQLAAPLVPTHFELRFGPARPGDADADDPQSCDDVFTLNINGEEVRITGRIDRIDVARVGEQIQFTVIDYKSGRKASLRHEHIESGEQLQLPIYVAAAQALVFGGQAQPLAAGYWTMTSGFDAKGVLAVQQGDQSGDHWERVQRLVQQRVGEFITAIRGGEFPVASRDEHCTSRCNFNTICRVAQVRSLGKIWPPESKG